MVALLLIVLTLVGTFLITWETYAWRTGRLPLITTLAQRHRLLALALEAAFLLLALWWPLHLVTGR